MMTNPMRQALGLTLVATGVILGACRPAPPERQPGECEPRAEVDTTRSRELLGTFEGVLPCADCAGIRTRLSLYAKGPYEIVDTKYELDETYLGTRDDDVTFTSSGAWNMERGSASDPDARLYVLDVEPDERRIFVYVNEGRIRQLDREARDIDSTLNYTLTRVQPDS